MSSENIPCLLYMQPVDPDTTSIFHLRTSHTCLGRLRPEQAEPVGAAVLNLNLPTISARHARIIRTADGYVLENWQGRHGIGLYERELRPGESHVLSHCDIFRLPALAEHVYLQFLEAEDQTQILPFSIERERGKVFVFGEQLRVTPMEYRLLAYLHQHTGHLCQYDELTHMLWSDANPHERKGNLEVLLHEVRAKLRKASGGFTFLETVRGQGVRLIL